MDFQSYLKLAGSKKMTILSVVIAFLIISALVSFIQPFQYSTEAKILVVQNFSSSIDPYNMTKSNEYLTNVLSQIISTNSFFIEVMNAGFNIDQDYFSADSRKQLDEWNKTVSADAISNAGIINIAVYHTDKYQSDQIMRAVIQVLKAKHAEYHGSGNNVEIMAINQPVISNFPVKPNFVMNLFLGLAVGLLSVLSYIYLFSGTIKNPVIIDNFQPEEKKYPETKQVNNTITQEHEYARISQVEYQDKNINHDSALENKYQSQGRDDLDLPPRGNINNIFGQSNLRG
jgi:capsular polysaccharide biosynthesis protein